MPTPGDTICGEILLERLAPASLGAEVFQPVFAARDLARDEGLWLTVVDGMFTPTSVELSSFMAGANALLGMRHPSLTRVVLVDREEDYCVVGYEQLPGAEPLSDLVVRGGAIALARTGVEVARGLAYLHRRGLLHGALGPGTVLVWEDTAVLWEYGLAGLCDPTVLGPRARTLGGDVVAPEILAGAPLSPAVDVFAWGAVMAAIASGELGADAVAAVMEGDVDPGRFGLMLGVVRQALAPEPGQRPRDGVHLLELLRRSLAAVDPNTELDGPDRATGGDDAVRELARRYLAEMQGVDRSGEAGRAPGGPMAGGGVAGSGALGRIDLVPRARSPEGRGGAILELDRTGRPDPRADALGRPRAPTRSATGWLRPPVPRAADGGLGGLFDPRPRMDELDHGVRKRTVLAGAVPRPQPPDERPPPPSARAGVPLTLGDDQDTPSEGISLSDPQLEPEPWDVVRAAVEGNPLPEDLPESMRETPPDLAVIAHEQARTRGSSAPPSDALPPMPEPDPVDRRVAPPAPVRSQPREPFRVPRTPGPHGPPAWLMAATLAVLCGLLAVASTFAASTARGGFSALWGRGAAAVVADGSASAEGPSPSPTEAAAVEGPCPSGMVLIDDAPQPAFCIDRAEYPGLDRVPATLVDLEHARKACTVRGHALCTDDQWTRACRGRARWRHPYGPRHEAGRCRVGQGSAAAPGNGGADPHCVTPEGVLDLVGNVAEWTADGTVRGGSVRSDATVGCGSRERSKPKAESPVIGFRCCAPTRGADAAAGSGER